MPIPHQDLQMEMDVEETEDGLPDVLALEDTEPVELVEIEPDGAIAQEQECGCFDDDDDEVVVTDEDDD